MASKNGFLSISFEKISVLDSYFIHRYIIINIGQVQFRVKSTNYYVSYGPFLTSKIVLRSISFEKISVLDSYFINRYIIIKYWSSSILGKIRQSLKELWPFFTFIFLQNACVRMRMAPERGHLCHIDTFLVSNKDLNLFSKIKF